MRPPLEQGLRDILSAVVDSSQSRQEMSRLVMVCHNLATAFVLAKTRAGTLHKDLLGLAAPDIAYDCIADLFQQDGDGRLLQVKAYFEGLELQEQSEQALLSHLRRLVFSKVNHGLFRMYNEVDPTLGKVLRNIKLAVDTLQNFVELQYFGEPCIAPAACDLLEWHPPIDRLELHRMLRSTASGKEHVPALLARLSMCLREQSEYCRIVPLMSVAMVFRSIYMEPVEHDRDIHDFPSPLQKDDLLRMIRETCESVKIEMMSSYVTSMRLPGGLFDQYFSTIEAFLVHRVAEKDGTDFSYYASLRERIPNLTLEEYRKSHRSRLEYFGKKVQKALGSRLMKA